jgi:hypothetical protein
MIAICNRRTQISKDYRTYIKFGFRNENEVQNIDRDFGNEVFAKDSVHHPHYLKYIWKLYNSESEEKV